MHLQQNSQRLTPHELRKHLARVLRQAVRAVNDIQKSTDHLDEAHALLQSLPLASGEYAVAANRLKNTQRYLNAGELGAASYELRLLEGSFSVPGLESE